MKNKIKEYYQKAELKLPYKSKWRHYRFQLPNGTFVKIKDHITSVEKLRKALIRYTPINCYATCSLWLNPTVLGKIKYSNGKLIEEKIRENPLLSSSFVYDCDLNLMENKDKFLEAYSFFEDQGYDLIPIFTGNGGQICLKDFYPEDIPIVDPVKRFYDCQEEMDNMLDKIIKKGLPVDISCAQPTRIFKLIPNTITKYGNLCEYLDINKLDKFEPAKILEIKIKKPVFIMDLIERGI